MELVVRDLPTLTGQLGKSERILSDRVTFDTRIAVATVPNIDERGKVTVMLRLTEDTLVTGRVNALAAKFPNANEEQLTAIVLVCGVNSTSFPAAPYTAGEVFAATVEVRTRIPQEFDTRNGVKTISKYHDACRILGVNVADYPQVYMYVVTKRALVANVGTSFGGNPWGQRVNTPPATLYAASDFTTMKTKDLKAALKKATISFDADAELEDLRALATANLVGKAV